MSTLDILLKYQDAFALGLGVTLRLCLLIWSAGLIIGTVLGVAGAHWRRSVGLTTRGISFFLTGVPVLVVLFWLHYPAQALAGVVIDPFFTAAIALSVINIFSVADTVRPVLERFPGEFATAARVCGLSRLQTLRHIQLPLVFHQIAPPLLTIQVTMLQATLFASLISVNEIFRVAQQINAIEYRPIEIYTALAVFFLAICLPLNAIAYFLQRRFSRNFNDR